MIASEENKPRKRVKMKYFVIGFEDGRSINGKFDTYVDAVIYADSHCDGYDYTIEEYESEEDYLINI